MSSHSTDTGRQHDFIALVRHHIGTSLRASIAVAFRLVKVIVDSYRFPCLAIFDCLNSSGMDPVTIRD